jgi:putative holliday junction resolvase
MGRILGIDYGEKRIGLALSDSTATVATPLKVLSADTPTSVLREIDDIVRQYGVQRIVVGLPLRMDGSLGPAAEGVRAFIDRLREEVSVPIATWDERFSTVTAQNALIESGARRKRRKEVVDKLAAQIVLQHYLDAQTGLPPPTKHEP